MLYQRDWTVKIGYAPTRRRMYDTKFAMDNKRAIRQEMEKLGAGRVEIVDIDWLNDEGLLIDPADVPAVARRFREAGVDAVVIAHVNFGSEEVVPLLGKALGVPVLLWGPRDAAPEGIGARQTDIQCGLFASGKGLVRYGVPFTYIENCRLEDEPFQRGFVEFVRVASAAREFRRMRIGQINTRPKPFQSVMVNESELIEKFGIEVIPMSTTDIAGQAEKLMASHAGDVAQMVADIESKVDCSAMAAEDIRKIAAVELAALQAAKQHGLTAMASECWSTFRQTMGIGVCFVFGDLTDRGLPTACETDIHGAVTSALAHAAAMGDTVPFLADLTVRHPTNDNAELLWHCGPFPQQLARDPAARQMIEYKGYWEIKGGDITIARFDGVRGEYKLFAGQARGVDGPVTNGNYVWAEVNDWPAWERKFVTGPYIHHVTGLHGKYVPVFQELTKYLGPVEFDTV